MSIDPVPFIHYVIDLSLQEIETAKGEKVTICKIASNAPLTAEYIEEQEGFYRWGVLIQAGKAFEFDSGCFSFILVKNCLGDIGIFAISQAKSDPTFVTHVYEDDKPIVIKPSTVSVGSKADFNFSWINIGQRLRIETVPDFDTFDMLRSALWKNQEKRQVQEEEEEGDDDE